MRNTRLAAVLGAVVLGLGGLALASPSSAKPATAPVVCSTWVMRSATGAYPAVVFGPAPAGSSVAKFSAVLKKPTSGIAPGVEFVSKNVPVTVTSATLVKVDYSLAGASYASGAVRLFGYEDQNANTLLDAPDWQDTATALDGTLVLNVPAGKSIGTLGMVYDASNDAEGTVTFTALKVGAKIFRFTTCPPVPSHAPSASASASASASHAPSASASASASVRPPSASPSRTSPSPSRTAVPSQSSSVGAPGSSGDDQTPVADRLPLTGPSGGTGKLWILSGLGGIMIVAGGLALALTRRRTA